MCVCLCVCVCVCVRVCLHVCVCVTVPISDTWANRCPVALNLSLQLHLDVEQCLVVFRLPLHLVPDLAQVALQLLQQAVEAGQLTGVTGLCVLHGLLQRNVLQRKKEMCACVCECVCVCDSL